MRRSSTYSDRYVRGLTHSQPLDAVINKIRKAQRLILLLDYDGTLVGFKGLPQLASPDGEVLELLTALAHRPHTFVHIVSGRQKESLAKWFGDIPIGLHAEHGFWSRLAEDPVWKACREDNDSWKTEAIVILKRYTANTPGSLIEEKTAGLTWHYRMADPEIGPLKARELQTDLTTVLRDWPVEVIMGEKIIEVRLKGVNKGIIVELLYSHYHCPNGFLIVAIGDDQTDEDMFAALPQGSVAIHVGDRESLAPYQLSDPVAVRAFLKQILSS